MNSKQLHESATVVDGLIIAKWSREIFEAMRRGGLTAANCTCCVWEGFEETMRNVAQWQQWFHTHNDLIMPIYRVSDIQRAKELGKTGIILGWQNITGIEDRIDSLELFKRLGVGVIQMAYNTQNLVGTGCYESRDSGLSDFGHDVVAEMNRLGILCDLSHVGPKTSQEVIEASKKPVAYSHCLPAGLKAHPRNKTDEQLRFIADHGGFVGVTMFPPFLPRGPESTVDDYVAAIAYVINIVGEESVGIGTDFTDGHDRSFFDWITHDKGYGRKLTDFGEIKNPRGMEKISDFPNLTEAMHRANWPPTRMRRVLGENWVNLLKRVWGE